MWQSVSLRVTAAPAVLGVLVLLLPRGTAAQTPITTVSYDTVRQLVETRVNEMLANNDQLSWGREPHVVVYPVHASLLNVRLNLKAEETILGIDVTADVWVDVGLSAYCKGGRVQARYSGLSWDTSLDDWIQDLVVGDVAISGATFEGFVQMVNEQFGSVQCGDVRMLGEGILVFPPDTYDPLVPAFEVGRCSDSTTGRTGYVYLIGSEIIAGIDAGQDPRDPDATTRLSIWVSPDANEANARQLDETRTVISGIDRRMIEPVGGQGHMAWYPTPPGVAYVGCTIGWQ